MRYPMDRWRRSLKNPRRTNKPVLVPFSRIDIMVPFRNPQRSPQTLRLLWEFWPEVLAALIRPPASLGWLRAFEVARNSLIDLLVPVRRGARHGSMEELIETLHPESVEFLSLASLGHAPHATMLDAGRFNRVVEAFFDRTKPVAGSAPSIPPIAGGATEEDQAFVEKIEQRAGRRAPDGSGRRGRPTAGFTGVWVSALPVSPHGFISLGHGHRVDVGAQHAGRFPALVMERGHLLRVDRK